MGRNLVIITGPTAIGKTNLSIEIAKKFNTEIISCDSRQFYKEISIGTAKPDSTQLSEVMHHFIGNISIHDYYNASRYEFEVLDLLEVLFEKYNTVVMVGGSGLYIDAVCYGIDDLPNIDEHLRQSLIDRINKEGVESLRYDLKKLDPEYYAKVDLKNKNRILRAVEVCLMTGQPYSAFLKNSKKERNFNIIKIGLRMDREKLYERVNLRVEQMFNDGLVDEAKMMLPFKKLNALNTVGYKELFAYFEGEYDIERAKDLIKRNTRHYAKKQISWFGRYDDIIWFEPTEEHEINQYIENQII